MCDYFKVDMKSINVYENTYIHDKHIKYGKIKVFSSRIPVQYYVQ